MFTIVSLIIVIVGAIYCLHDNVKQLSLREEQANRKKLLFSTVMYAVGILLCMVSLLLNIKQL